jgi:gluconate 5-dehydrogenase
MAVGSGNSTVSAANDYFSVTGKVALVTGGYGGIGEAVCHALARAGASVAIAGHNLAKAQALAAALQANCTQSFAAAFDATSQADTARMVDEVAARFGRLDILVNTVGGQKEQSALEVSAEDFDRVLSVNVRAVMFQAQAAAREMIRAGGGKQIHFGSVRSMLALRGRGFAAYCAAKGGIPILCKQLAAEWAEHRINVNVIAPTFVRTPQVEHWLSDPDFYNSLIARIPFGRVGEPEDIVGAVLFLASRASNFITGQTLYVDGGVTATQ